MRSSILLVLLALAGDVAGLAVATPAAAENLRPKDNGGGDKDHDKARDGVNAGALVPLADVIKKVQEKYPGKLLDASLHELVPGQPVYRILILMNDGRRLTVWCDAKTGQIIRVEG